MTTPDTTDSAKQMALTAANEHDPSLNEGWDHHTTDRAREAGHTPGPWKADKWGGDAWTVCAPNSHYSVCHLGDCNNAEANARLIAAAPETAARLAECVAALKAIIAANPDEAEAWGEARAALARAEGRAQ